MSKPESTSELNPLASLLVELGADTLKQTLTEKPQWLEFCDSQNGMFVTACENKPDKTPASLLLGLITKNHLEATGYFQSQLEASKAVESAISDNLGDEHKGKFSSHATEQLIFMTHLWLFIQGRLGMDFSLANDHADASANLLIEVIHQQRDELRVAFVESFYQGKALYDQANPKQSLWQCLTHWLKRK